MRQLAKAEPCPWKAPVAREQDRKRTRTKHNAAFMALAASKGDRTVAGRDYDRRAGRRGACRGRGRSVDGGSRRVLETEVKPEAHPMSDEWKAFVAVGQSFAAHETVQHARREYVRGSVHANSVEGLGSPA